jgi:uncharacterized protein (TIGR02996 family)
VLLDEIHANLADDGPRLVYADQLQQAGDPRGELIAVQCELARHGYAQKPPSWDWIGDALADDGVDPAHIRKLRAREKALLDQHRASWLAPARAAYPGAPESYFRFERGFVAHVEVNATQRAGDRPAITTLLGSIATAIPTLESIGFSSMAREVVERTFESPALATLRALAMPAFGARGLVTLPRVALRELVMHGDDGEAVAMLFAWPAFGGLQVLELNTMRLGANEAAALLAASGSLHELQLRGSKLGAVGAKAIANSPKTRELRILSVLGNAIGPDGTIALAEQLAALRALDLRKNKIGVAGAKAIGASCRELRTLDLTGNTLGEDGLAALAGGDGLGELRELCLQQTLLDDKALAVLAQSPLLERLRVLSLRSNKLTDAGARALARSKHARNLRLVNLNNNQITAAGKQALADSEHLERARVTVR